ncbi:TM0106 family RecB-like putative nuclease [Scytonema sp. UIC 10036]|uniref:TM0106 family RecB-like putative nuclease n=1 Tax=Scytonema sp. UIC 10036 TaxID=2304196 RepID=UPI0012DA79DD|nr:TM0106 family RecB-like putative nuclease [Scytonema sp. UIC 10036]MUH01845.1 TM0106 family RecB-like putative nuclease [Scytonema sp. UIC 10036]
MLINAELLLQYQRCKRRPFLDLRADRSQRDPANDLLLKLQQDKIAHKQSVLEQFNYQRPDYRFGDWETGEAATLELMQQGVECIHAGVLTVGDYQGYTLLSRTDLLVRQAGMSRFGDWVYVPVNIELGKRPKQEYQITAAFHAYVLAKVQQVELKTAWLSLRGKEENYPVDISRWEPQMHEVMGEFIQTLEQDEPPEVFISRQKCSLCTWYSSCYKVAQNQKHLSLLPGVTPVRYKQLKALDITTVESLAKTNPTQLEQLPGFDRVVAPKLILQAQSVVQNRPIILPDLSLRKDTAEDFYNSSYSIQVEATPRRYVDIFNETYPLQDILSTAPVEIFFDIEAQPDLHLDYLLGVLIVDRESNTEIFYSLLAESQEDERLIWEQFLNLVGQYPDAPIYHFCVYEFDTVQRLAKLYGTPYSSVFPVLNRFVDIYEILTQNVALPVESYALKTIARWLGFKWRDLEASGAKCIYWYDQWLQTGDRTLLEVIQRYNEDDCRATRSVKDWLVNFFLRANG